MNAKKTLLIGSTTMILALGVAAGTGKTVFKTNATTTWKHYSAIMPTQTEVGVREYWTMCDGSAPVFEQPDGTIVDATLTAEQKQAIVSNPVDERIIPTLAKIQNGINAGLTGTISHEYTNIYNAYAYNYLDATTKGELTGDFSNINTIKALWDSAFDVIWDAGKDALPQYDNLPCVAGLSRAYDATYGNYMAIETASIPATETFQAYFYGWGNKTYAADSIIHFGVYSPFEAAAATSQTCWAGAYGTANKFGLTAKGWTTISGTGASFNSNGKFTTSMADAISLQRYVDSSATLSAPYQGTYRLTSIIAEKMPTEDGAVIHSSLKPFTVVTDTWGQAAVVTQNVNTEHGVCNQIDMPNKTTAFEAKWSDINTAVLANYQYAKIYVYVPVRNQVYFSLQDWRRNVLNVGVDPNAADNGAVANAGGVYDVGWHEIVFPTSYINQDHIFFEIFNGHLGEETGWLVSSIYGYNNL